MIFATFSELFDECCNLANVTPFKVYLSIASCWRRKGEEAMVIPRIYSQSSATHAGAQVAGVSTLLVTYRNLQWRFALLHSAFVVCKQNVVPGGLQVV